MFDINGTAKFFNILAGSETIGRFIPGAPADLYLSNTTLSGTYEAQNSITVEDNVTVSGPTTLKAGNNIHLKPGFTAPSGIDFTAKIEAVPSTPKRFYYLKDHLGSVRVTVDEAGEIVSSDDYDPWGMILNGRSTDGTYLNAKYKFTGKERDIETGYDYFGARYYDSRIGRWLQVDPLAEKYFGWSPYNYTLNNPLKYFDPDGKGIKPSEEQRKRLEAKAKEYEQNKMEFAAAWESGNIWDKITSTFNVTWDAIEKGFEEFSLMPTPSAMVLGEVKAAETVLKSGKTVLGKFPDYIKLSGEIGANRFNIPAKIWDKMTEAERWSANVKFLDRAITRGDEIILSNPVKNIKDVTGTFRKELDYLIEKGFKLSDDGTRMIK